MIHDHNKCIEIALQKDTDLKIRNTSTTTNENENENIMDVILNYKMGAITEPSHNRTSINTLNSSNIVSQPIGRLTQHQTHRSVVIWKIYF